MPMVMVKIIKKEVKQGGFASVSEFFRHLVRSQLATEFRKDEGAFRRGEGKILKSLKDLR